MNFNIPAEWLFGNVQLSLFLKLERINRNMPRNNYRFLSNEIDFQNKSLIEYLTENNKESVSKTNNSVILFSPPGTFYSIDEFNLKSIKFSNNKIHITINYIWIEDQDGNAYNIIPAFIIPLNSTITKYKKLVVSFNSMKRDFYTGLISKNPDLNIQSIKIEF